MSYLVDALKKAERERHENQRADMRSLAEGEPPPQGLTSGHTLRWLIGLLVVCNAALLVYLFLPAYISAGVPASQPEVVVSDDVSNSASGAVPAESGAGNDEASERPTAPSRDNGRALVAERNSRADNTHSRASSRIMRPPADQPRDDGLPDMRLSAQEQARRGRVTYSRSPLDNSATWQRDAGRDAPVQRSVPAGPAPDVTINGHLYSSVPGRSFILVAGRRYHEGERLASGPAVESIDAAGATLNYRGKRYQVDGPR